jgi:DNA-damage-inducible protein J
LESLSRSVNIFLKQVVMQRGIPLDVKIPPIKPVGVSLLTETEMNTELEKGYSDFKNGKTKSVESVFSELHKDYGIKKYTIV